MYEFFYKEGQDACQRGSLSCILRGESPETGQKYRNIETEGWVIYDKSSDF